MKQPTPATASDEALRSLVQLRHRDPHSLLGLHEDGDGVVVRAFRPDAESIFLIPESGGRVPMKHRHEGVFEVRVNGTREPFDYLLEVFYPGGTCFTIRDPYAFWPTWGDIDLHLTGEGRHERIWERMGAHPMHHYGHHGVSFALWAPEATSISVVGDFNGWDGRLHPMRALGTTGIWELFIPELSDGVRYKYEIRTDGKPTRLKSDPFAFRTEVPPLTASVVHDLRHYRWTDGDWMDRRKEGPPPEERPLSIYELHLASWRRIIEDENRPLTYRELAVALGDYLEETGFTHVELLPVAEHPFGGSWGYQVTGYYAPTARFGHPDDLRFLIDHLHGRGIGVLVDWVPAHFPTDAHGLAELDGTHVYEHADPRRGFQPEWNTLIFNYGRNEVRNFLIANALFWLEEYHVDGLRVDAVASMLYLDYGRSDGQWLPNQHGGRENLEAVEFLKELNEVARVRCPGTMIIAEESTAWPKVTGPVQEGGLGFTFKWNMGWMHDTLSYFQTDPLYRKHRHDKLTFGLMYAFSERFVLPLSHDEVVHMKGSLYGKMAGMDAWQKLANLRALYAWMWAHPGKKLLFMGGELAQSREWNHDSSLDWHLLEDPGHAGIKQLVSALNRELKARPALHELDAAQEGFTWIQADSAAANVLAFIRWGKEPTPPLVCVANLNPMPKYRYRVGVPSGGSWREVLNTDGGAFGGSGLGNMGRVEGEQKAWDGQPASLELTLPPLSVLWLEPEGWPPPSSVADTEARAQAGTPQPASSQPAPSKSEAARTASPRKAAATKPLPSEAETVKADPPKAKTAKVAAAKPASTVAPTKGSEPKPAKPSKFSKRKKQKK